MFLRRVDTPLHTMGKVMGDGGFKMGDLSNGGDDFGMGEAYTSLRPMQFFGSWKGRGWSSKKVGKKGYLLKGCCRGCVYQFIRNG